MSRKNPSPAFLSTAWTIRKAQGDEAEWCAQLMSRNDPWVTLGRDLEQCRMRCFHPDWELHVVCNPEENPCGFLLLNPLGFIGYPYIASIAIEERYRGHGLGEALIGHVSAALGPDRKFLFLCVSSFNERARSFYLRIGFQPVGILKDFVVDGLDECLMCKRLNETAG